MSKHKHRRKTNICPNCGTILQADFEFCPTCGQENHDLKVPIGHVVYEFIESVFHFDTKVWNTLKAIVTKPGVITSDFVTGKRARYVPPARLYVFVAFFFFLMLNKVSDKWVKQATELDPKTINEQIAATQENEWDLGEAVQDLRSLGYTAGDSLEKALGNQPLQTQQAVVRQLKLRAITDSTQKYGNRMPFRVRDALLQSLEVKDSILLRKSGFEFDPITDGLDLNHELDQLARLGAIKPAQKDSALAYFGQQTASQIYQAVWVIKRSVVDDSLQRFGGTSKLPLSFKAKLVSLFSLDYEADSSLLARAGIDRLTYESLENEYSSFTIENRKVTKKQVVLYRTFNEAQLDSLLLAESPKYNKNGKLLRWFTRKLFKQGLKLNGTNDANTKEFIYKEFSHLVNKYLSFVMFLMMPVVAFLLVIIYYRLRKYYYEHLIFSVHAHTVLFILMTIGFSLDYFLGLDTSNWILLIGMIYFFIALRNVYRQSWVKTFAKFILLLLMYLFVAVLFFGGAILVGFVNF
jgi:hypothetical protein